MAARALRPPLAASDPRIAWLHTVADGSSGIIQAYAAHDGSKSAGGVLSRLPNPPGASFTRATTWLSAAAAEAERSRLATALGHSGARALFPIGRVGSYRPSSAYEAEDQRCVAIDVASGELVGVTYFEGWGSSPAKEERLGVSWAMYLTDLLSELEAGALEAARDQFSVICLTTRQKPLGTQPAPREDGEVFLALLRERGLIELCAEPSPKLIQRVGKAIRARSEAKQVSALRAAFDDADEVADDFADDDQLLALMAFVCGGPG